MKRRLRIFVCSTFTDLTDERKAVLDAIRRLRLEHDSMEFFGARANEPIQTCLAEVRASDAVVVVVGHSYGSVVPGRGLSFSQAEYEEGYGLKKPCLVYVRDDNVPILPKFVERDPEKRILLENWKATLHTRHTVASFKQSSDLGLKVETDLRRTCREFMESFPDTTTVQRGNAVASQSVYRRTTLKRNIALAIGLFLIGALLYMPIRSYFDNLKHSVVNDTSGNAPQTQLSVAMTSQDKDLLVFEGYSMLPTILNGQRVVLEKFDKPQNMRLSAKTSLHFGCPMSRIRPSSNA